MKFGHGRSKSNSSSTVFGIFIGTILSAFLAGAAAAQTTQAGAPADPFSAGTWTIQVTAQGIAEASDDHEDQLYGGAIGTSYYVFDNIAAVLDFPLDYVSQSNSHDAVIGGFTLLARWHFLEGGKWSIFADGGAGAMIADQRVPRNGTNFNFTPQAGLGITYELRDNVFLLGGARAFHLSNAGIDRRNPGINIATEGYVGLLFKL